MIDIECWAIKNLDTGYIVGNKEGRTMWKVKPTNAIDTIKWKAKNYYNKELSLVPVRIRITEVNNDTD